MGVKPRRPVEAALGEVLVADRGRVNRAPAEA